MIDGYLIGCENLSMTRGGLADDFLFMLDDVDLDGKLKQEKLCKDTKRNQLSNLIYFNFRYFYGAFRVFAGAFVTEELPG